MASEIPDSILFESAVVIPLGCSTAALGLFQDAFLNLQFPTEPPQKPTGKMLLIWGGSSSVGSNAIQLAVAAGYEVITTATKELRVREKAWCKPGVSTITALPSAMSC
jgi:NADPH:quinone reductase-like Zn-dependent oxidoreductase